MLQSFYRTCLWCATVPTIMYTERCNLKDMYVLSLCHFVHPMAKGIIYLDVRTGLTGIAHNDGQIRHREDYDHSTAS